MNEFELIAREEGYRESPYICSAGYPTVGYGLRIGPKGADLSMYTFTLSEPTAFESLKQKAMQKESKLQKFDWFDKLTGDRRKVIISMAYQLGTRKLCKFVNMISAIEQKNWKLAATEALDSKWAKKDTPARALRHAHVLEFGDLSEVY